LLLGEKLYIPELPEDKAITTLVCFHDLLGFGNLLAASGGTLDSGAGNIAYDRINNLRGSLQEASASFPDGTEFFHFNDTAAACLDIDIDIVTSHTDHDCALAPVADEIALTALRFVGASAYLHHRSIVREDTARLGPAGRTFVVLGKRWQIEDSGRTSSIFQLPILQANLAFAEAYQADKAGSRAGFSHRPVERMYINDLLHFVLMCTRLTSVQAGEIERLGIQGRGFPLNLLTPESDKITVPIFHRTRTFHSVLSHHAYEVNAALDRAKLAAYCN
jgi:hypothetical protein